MITGNNLRSLSILTIVCALALGGYYLLVKQPNLDSNVIAKNSYFYPELNKQLDDVVHISLAKHDKTIDIYKADNAWVIKDKANFPVATPRVYDLLLELANVRVVEAKTHTPENFNKIGVGEIEREDSDAVLLTLYGLNKQILANLYVGNVNPTNLQDATVDYIFVRKKGDMQSYMVKGRLPVTVEFNEWVEQPLIKVESNDVKRIKIANLTKAPDEIVEILKSTKDDLEFELQNIGENSKLNNSQAIGSLSYTLSFVNFDDVIAADSVPDWQDQIAVELGTFDDKDYKFTIGLVDGMPYAKKDEVWLYKLPEDIYATLLRPKSDYLDKVEQMDIISEQE